MADNSIVLSKTQYCKGVQCRKILWMDRHMRDKFNISTIIENRFNVGNEVGTLARQCFGDYVQVQFSYDKWRMAEETKQLVKAGTSVIAEAAFTIDDLYCAVDILRVSGKRVDIVEVKSSTSHPCAPAHKVKDIYLHDLAFQYHVLRRCGLMVSRVFVMQLNSEYERSGELDLNELFVLTDCTDEIKNQLMEIESNISLFFQTAAEESEPGVPYGYWCDKPYICGYKDYCAEKLPENSVYHIGWGMRDMKKYEAYKNGYKTFSDILYSGGSVKLNDKQQRQVEFAVNDRPPHVDKKSIKRFLSAISYPLYHLDFETFQQAVPQWDGLKPYTQIPFQYSLHIQHDAFAIPKHKEFLAEAGKDPRREIAERLCKDIPSNVCVIAYYMTFEKTCIRYLAEQFRDLAIRLMIIHDNMVDLAYPFQSGAYYCREMGGGYSIKAVLPALCPDDPELDYNSLPLIHNGSEAMFAYATLKEQLPDAAVKIRQALLAYCRLDTLAMVKILERLYSV